LVFSSLPIATPKSSGVATTTGRKAVTMAQFSTVTDMKPERKATVAPTAAVQRKNLRMMLSRYGSFCGLPTLQHRELHALVASWLLPGFIVDAREYRLLSIFLGAGNPPYSKAAGPISLQLYISFGVQQWVGELPEMRS
jgi:hypothetical protein